MKDYTIPITEDYGMTCDICGAEIWGNGSKMVDVFLADGWTFTDGTGYYEMRCPDHPLKKVEL